ncbi:MAG: DJ-1/PfpI family protein [Bryobacteraceae bacterium]|nr:DJ-1/PfpI family protein [Bryobacteraceae bacterium]
MAKNETAAPAHALPARRVVVLATPGAQSLEIAGPVEVFSMVAAKLREAGRERMTGYAVEVVSATEDLTVRSSSGLTMLAHRTWRDVDYPIDTLLVAGGMEPWSGENTLGLLDWIRLRAGETRRYGSICTGAFVLAQAGILDGRRATTHWYFCQQLQRDYPKVIVDPEPIFIQDGPLYTSAGVTSGIDLAVSMVEQDFGLDIGLRVARALVLFLRRPAGQNQFSTALAFQGASRIPLRELPVYVLEHLQDALTVEDLSARVSMSVRNFSRVFAEEFGTTPAAFVTKLRVETAKRLVEESARSFDEIAVQCGLGSADSLRRSFKQEFGMTAAEIRQEAIRRQRNEDRNHRGGKRRTRADETARA